jgi:hypothetical protein
MQPLDDYPLGTEPASPPPVPPSGPDRRWWIVAAICLLIGAAVAAFFLLRRPAGDVGAPATEVDVPAAQEGSQARGPLGPRVEPRELPALDLTDPVVRELLRGLSSRPELAAWLATDGLIRTFVASVDNIANGRTPAPHLRRLAPSRPFVVEARGSDFVIDPRSYARYNGIAETVASLDADGLARVYATLHPRLQEAYQELGYPGSDFDAAMERAIARLLSTPQLGETVQVRQAPVLYKFSDERIESLSPAQKQLLRMGPRNVRLVQDKLREIGRALGIPAERLR